MTTFYNEHLLLDVSTPNPYNKKLTGILTPPMLPEKVAEFWEKQLRLTQKDVHFLVKTSDNKQSAYIEIKIGEFTLSTLTINTTMNNCSGLLFSNLYSESNRANHLSSYLWYEAIKWAREAGYSFIECSCTTYQLEGTMEHILKKSGFKPLGPGYYNPRSGNRNQWFYLLLNQDKIEEEDF